MPAYGREADMKLKKSALAVLLLIAALIIFAVIHFSRPRNTETPETPEPTAEVAENTNTETTEPAAATASSTTDTQQAAAQPADATQPSETTQQVDPTAEPTPAGDTSVHVTDSGDVVIELQEDEETFGE